MEKEQLALQIAQMWQDTQSRYQLFGKLVYEYRKANIGPIKELTELVKEQGVSIPPNSLSTYAWTYERTHNLDVPDDMPYRTRQALAGIKDVSQRRQFVEQYNREGITYVELEKRIRAYKGKPTKAPVTISCEKCGHQITIS